MSVHFDFVLNDIDAENLFDIINDAKVHCLEQALTENKKPSAITYRKHATYIDRLKKRLKNERCAHKKLKSGVDKLFMEARNEELYALRKEVAILKKELAQRSDNSKSMSCLGCRYFIDGEQADCECRACRRGNEDRWQA